jgi:Flp pilus assembly protein TadD
MFSTSSDKVPSDAGTPSTRKKPKSRLLVLLVLGVLAIGGGLALRNSSWARERRLKALSVEDLAYAVHDDPNDALTFLYYGSELLNTGNLAGSEAAFQRATQLDPKMARAFVGLGSARFRLAKMKSANEAFQKAVELNPNEEAAYLGLSETFYQAGSPHRAIEPLEKLVALEPKNAIAWYQLGRLYGEDHQADLAYSALQKAVALDASKSEYWRDLAYLSQHYGKTTEAEQQLMKALHLSPNDPIAHFRLGQIYAQKEDTPVNYGRAEQELLAALARDPQMAEGYFELGQLYERHSNFALAVVNYRKAFDLNSSDDKALNHLGFCLIKTGARAEGEKKMRGSQMLAASKKEITDTQNRLLADPQNRELHLRLARIWRKYENDTDALKEYRAFKMLGPTSASEEKEIQDFLKQQQSKSPNNVSGQTTR